MAAVRRGRAPASRTRRVQQRDGVAHGRPRSRTAAETARRRPARTSRRRRARGALISTSMPSDSASVPQPALARERAQRRASATVHSVGGLGHSSSARAKAWRRTRRSNAALCATRTRTVEVLGQLGEHELGARGLVDHGLRDPGEALDACARAARARRTSVSQRSCSSPPPTSTAPSSVSSHASPAGRWSPCRRRGTPSYATAGRAPSDGWCTRRAGRHAIGRATSSRRGPE